MKFHRHLPVLAIAAAALVGAAVLAAKPKAPPAALVSPAAPAATDGPRIEGLSLLVLPMACDDESLGKAVREALNFKAKRLGVVVYDPSSVAENLGNATPSPDTPPAKLAALGREKFQADIIVTGRIKGDSKACDIALTAVYTDPPQNPRVFQKTYHCPEPQFRGIEMAKAVYDILGLDRPTDPLRMLQNDPQVQRRWSDGPNLVKNPGFEEAAPSGKGPADWQEVEKEMAWVPNPDGPGKIIKYEMSEATAGSYGLDFYSDWIPIEAGATYRFSCRYKSLGPTPKVFLKGYHEFPADALYPAQRRETYRRQVHPAGGKNQWNTVVADFVPEALRPDQQPTFLKVDLYAYWPKGVIYWDDIVLKKVRDAPPPPPAK